jgi:hypothetical protein
VSPSQIKNQGRRHGSPPYSITACYAHDAELLGDRWHLPYLARLTRGWQSCKTHHMKSFLRRLLFIFLGLVVLVAIFYAEEDWRGKRAWENCKRELEAKGETLDLNAYIPPPVPDGQNFFKAPRMTEWFVKPPAGQATTNKLTQLLQNADTDSTITSKTAAKKYLAWSDQFAPDFELIREAFKRPYARIDGDYSSGINIPKQNFLTVSVVARTLAQRAKCDLLLGQTEQALREVTLLHDMSRVLEVIPVTMPAAMINVDVITGSYVDTIADGMQLHAWQQPQFIVLQKQLAEVKLTPIVVEFLKEEPVATCRWCEMNQPSEFFGNMKILPFSCPRGWVYQNMVNVVLLFQKLLEGCDLAHDTVSPSKVDEAFRDIDKFVAHKSPYRILAVVAVPNYTRAFQVFAHNQTMANEAQIACALECYHFAHGAYPETLDALAPQFIGKIPHDIIGGQPLKYRHTNDGNFLLYSIGWNETDDGGQEISELNKYGKPVYTKGDWVWKN